jgi:hypothetical protein
MNYELESISNEAVMVQCRCYSIYRLNVLMKTTKNLSHDTRYPVSDMNQAPLEYKARTSLLGHPVLYVG